MEEQRPAVVLASVRRLAADAQRRGTLIDPRQLQDVIDGRKA